MILFAVLLGITVSLLDQSLTLIASPGSAPFRFLLCSALLDVVLVALSCWLLWVISIPVLRLVGSFDEYRWVLALVMGVGILFRLGPLWDLVSFDLNLKWAGQAGVATLVAVAAALWVSRASRRAGAEAGSVRLFARLIAGPLILTELTVLSWAKCLRPSPFLEVPWGIPLLCACGVVPLGIRVLSRKTQRVFPGVLIALLILTPWIWALQRLRSGSEESSRPVSRIVVIVADALRRDALSCYGSTGKDTPHMDSLAQEGFLFEDAVSPASWTLPSVSTYLTGVSPWVHGMFRRESSLPERLPTLAERMRSSGYDTAAFMANGNLCRGRGLERGFSSYIVHHRLSSVSSYALGGKFLEKVWPQDVDMGRTAGHVTEGVSSWLRRHRRSDFFLWIHYLEPHAPYCPPRDIRPQGVPTSMDDLQDLARITSGEQCLSLEEREVWRQLYLGEVQYMDRCLGDLLRTLKVLDLYDESLIVFTSDHGEQFFEHGNAWHGYNLMEEALRIPLIIKPPSGHPIQGRGQRVAASVSTESLTPTLMELCDLELTPDLWTSPSLMPWMTGEAGISQDSEPLVGIGTLYFENQAYVRWPGWKYIRGMDTGEETLFDLIQDPGERAPLSPMPMEPLEKAREALKNKELLCEKISSQYQISHSARAGDPQSLKDLGYLH